MITGAAQREFIKSIASAFPNTGFTEEREIDTVALVWERDGLSAGAGIDSEQAWVWLASATAPAASADDAIGVLGAIFADEIVAVCGYEQGVWISEALANAADLHRPPHLLIPMDPRTIARVDEIQVRSWSGARDGSLKWPREDQ